MDENYADASPSNGSLGSANEDLPCEALQIPETEVASTTAEAASSLFTATRKARGRSRCSGSKLKSASKPKNSIKRKKPNSRSKSSTRKTKSTPAARSRDRKTPSSRLKKPKLNCVSRKRSSRISIKHNKCCKPNLTMNKAYLQFLREYCERPQELSGPDLAQKAARAWCRLSDVKKQKFLARRTKKICKKARFCAIQ
ncbi:protamine-like protein 99C [Drosophila montana]|uniref:protamine-like protein 99C n=1 Tax=Drosophila montana TaxID=40370 RepID=UPI00313B637C